MDKRLKDPIYGYINIPIEYTKRVIDTAVFQRLRRVIQTSYAPLYSSAIHNRFVHSIGVFYLGQIAAEKLKKEILEKELLSENEIEEICKVYKLACLFHDVGHAPFLHTGEGYYKTDDYKSTELHKMLVEAVGGNSLINDIPREEAKAAAPHEIMSCIIGIKEFGSFFSDSSSKEFFSRCITGYNYQISNKDKDIKNCFISMLNSKVIDVDRLDYLIKVLLQSMVAHGLNKIVFSSTAATYGEPGSVPILETDKTEPTNAYSETKLAMEKLFKWTDSAHCVKYVSLRYFNACGA